MITWFSLPLRFRAFVTLVELFNHHVDYFKGLTLRSLLQLGRWPRAITICRGSFTHPQPVRLICRIDDFAFFLLCHSPFVRFRVRIGKGKSCPEIVICPGHVDPYRPFHSERKGGIIEVGNIFVHQQPEHGLTGRGD